jgi:uncharacterized membrane protein YGL010W
MTLVGILLTPVFLALASVPLFLLSLGLFVGGYLVQFLGHAFDRTEPGEITELRRVFTRRHARVR